MHKVNKKVIHNGKTYEKGDAIKKDDAGFKQLHADGHIESFAAEEKAEGEEAVAGEGEEAAAADEKHSGRRRR